MTQAEKDRIEKDLSDLYETEQTSGTPLSGTFNLMATMQDLGNDLEALNAHDYDADIEETYVEGVETVDSMAKLYLNENTELLNHPYIKKKRQHDAANQADMLFLQKITKKAVVMQLRAMDLGANSPRDFETFYNGIKELRENIKHAALTQNQMEGFYKMLRTDLGISDEPIGKEIEDTSTSTAPKHNIVDPKNLNSKLEEMMKEMAKNNPNPNGGVGK